jgi:CheY-like chemotaxis protein
MAARFLGVALYKQSDNSVCIRFELGIADYAKLRLQLESLLEVVRHILDPLHGKASWEPLQEDTFSLTITLPVNRPVVLVIEDNEDTIRLFERYLADQDCRVIGVNSARESLALACHLNPVAIILDVMIPIQDGWEILQNLRMNDRTRDIPIIVCSVLPQESLARALGAKAYLRKPFGREDLIRVLEPLLLEGRL